MRPRAKRGDVVGRSSDPSGGRPSRYSRMPLQTSPATKPTATAAATTTTCATDTAKPATSWWLSWPLSEGKNAHKTNTREQFDAAMKDGTFNWFEGDVRKELHGDRVEMRHDTTAEPGD